MKKEAQFDGGAGVLGGGPLGLEGMPEDPGMGMMGDPMMDPAAIDPSLAEPVEEQSKDINYALETPDDILEDYKVIDKLNEEIPVEKIVSEMWELYGGSYLGQGADRNKSGKRTIKSTDEDNRSDEAKQQEVDQTENSRWERLLQGKYITDIFPDTQTLTRSITNLIKSTSGGAGAAGGPPGGGLMASNSMSWYRYAKDDSNNIK
jgi:hypothetical protein